MAKVTKAACARKGKKFVHIKGKASFCAGGKKRKGSRRGKKGIASMSKAQRKAITKKACAKKSNSAKFRKSALCKWARS